MNTEPVTIFAGINAAITATLAILLFVGVDPELVGAITAAAVAWVGVAALYVRSKVTPTAKLDTWVDTPNGAVLQTPASHPPAPHA